MTNKNKLIIIGLDGATWDIIYPLLQKGFLPKFSEIYFNGVHGILQSTIPPLTPPAWTSAFTGVNPGKHNIFDFFFIEDYGKRIVTSKDRKAKAVWNIINNSVIINVPQTYPPEKIDGIMISGMGTPSNKSNFTYPSEFKDILIENDYVIDYEDIFDLITDEKLYMKNIHKMIKKRTELTLNLINNFNWNLMITVFVATDRVQHFFWNKINNIDLVSEVSNTYLEIDKSLSLILNSIEKDTNILIFSDHGFRRLTHDVFINSYLEETGYLSKSKHNKNNGVVYKIINTQNLIRAGAILSKIGLRKLVRKLYKIYKNKFINLDLNLIEWNRTKAWFFSLSGQSIRLNLNNREPNGLIEEANYEETINALVNNLYQLNFKNEKVIKKIYKSKEIYYGPYVKNAPDLIISPEEGYCLQEGFNSKIVDISRQGPALRNGDHSLNGIFMAYGPDIKKGQKIENAKIYDIAPTILHIFGLQIPNDMDGRVLTEIFEENSELAKRKPEYVDPSYYEDTQKQKTIKKIRNLKNKEKIKVRGK